MQCFEFRELRATYGKFPVAEGLAKSEEYSAWLEHLQTCTDCSEWELGCRVRDRGFDPARFPCVHVADQVTDRCSVHESPWQCPDTLVVRTESGEYGLPIRDGGSSCSLISYCLWCGAKLTVSEA